MSSGDANAEEGVSDEIKRLRRCINDLVSMLALPALWTGREPIEIIRILLDALLETLRLDFACAALTDASGQAPFKIVQVAERESHFSEQQVASFLASHLGATWTNTVPDQRLPLGPEHVSMVSLPLGLAGEVGIVLVGSRRADFPRQTDALLLGVATNQALIGLREAQLLSEQKRVSDELERRVADRTRELAEAYEDLQRETEGRERLEEALAKARSELAHVARVTSLGALTASIAHEINQPLSGILTNAGTSLRLLADDAPDPERLRETTMRTIRDARRAADVVTRLRALFANKPSVREPLDLNEVAREVVTLLLHELRRGSIVLQQDLDEALPPVTGDRVQLQQVVLNLLMNGADALSGVGDRPRLLCIATQAEANGCVRLSVRDNGAGLDPQAATRLFEPFNTTKATGMGLGLSICRSIVESHHGRLWAEPNDGPGTTFSFSIPATPSLPKPSTPRASPDYDNGQLLP